MRTMALGIERRWRKSMSAIFPPHRKNNAFAGRHYITNFDAASACQAARRTMLCNSRESLWERMMIGNHFLESETWPRIHQRRGQQRLPRQEIPRVPLLAALH